MDASDLVKTLPNTLRGGEPGPQAPAAAVCRIRHVPPRIEAGMDAPRQHRSVAEDAKSSIPDAES
jgi:hypothetical protein